MSATRAPLFARVLVGAGLAMTLVTAGFGVQSVREWRAERLGRSVREQRATFRNVAWFRAEFTGLVDRLLETLPADAKILVEPMATPEAANGRESGPPRWYLPLAHYAWPMRFYVRRPDWAATFFTYDQWVEHHFEVLDLDGGGPADPRAPGLVEEEERAIDERGIEWRLRIPAWPFEMQKLRLDRRVDGAWVEDPSFPLPEWGA